MPQKLEIEDTITVGGLADKLMIPVSKLMTELMKNGVLATINERLDFETAQIVTDELELDVELVKKAGESRAEPAEVPKRDKSTGEARPPVVAVMGHVDHGKTTLLDAIKGSTVVEEEAGGITQHISAYQVKHKDRLVTFLDTPGHEAFAALREHGAQLTDMAIIVVAADDGVKPQTVEAIRFARKAGVKIVVAISKVDKAGADPNRTKQQLADHDLLVEDWGGDIVAVEVSAKSKQGVDDLMDMILLVADLEDLRAETKVPAQGLIIESHMEKGKGPVAVALVEKGTLQKGDYVVAGTTYGRVRRLDNTGGGEIAAAKPSTPVVITGFKALPEFGDEFQVLADEKTARTAATKAMTSSKQHGHGSVEINSSQLIRIMDRSRDVQKLNVIIKADVQGSVTSVTSSLKSLDTEEVVVQIVASGVGTISENDVHLAATSGAIIYGFNVSVTPGIRQLANRDRVQIRLFSIIYELLDDARSELSRLLSPEVVESPLGRLIVKAIFRLTKSEVICGGEVTKGKLSLPAVARVLRGSEELAEVQITGLKKGPQDVKEVGEGEMCGVSFKTESKVDLKEEDRLEFFSREVKDRSL